MAEVEKQDSDEDDFIPLESKDAGEKEVEVITSSPSDYPPWFREQSAHQDYPYRTLHNEILDLCDMLMPNPQEKERTARALTFAKTVIQQLFRGAAKVEMFGSQLTGLALPGSDLDLVVLGGGPSGLTKVASVMFGLQRAGEVTSVQRINAKVPLVKFVHVQTGRQVDMSFDQESGLDSGQAAKLLMRQMPPVRPLVMVMKLYLSQRKMNETYAGYVGSFLLQLMVVALVQKCGRDARARGLEPPTNLGFLLDEFLDFYGNELNYASTGVTLLGQGGGGFYNKREIGWFLHNKPFSLSVQNPHNPSVDVGSNSFRIPAVQNSFRATSLRLKAAFQRAAAVRRPQSFLKYVVYPTPDLVARTLPPPVFTTRFFDEDHLRSSRQEQGKRVEGESDDEGASSRDHRSGKRKSGGGHRGFKVSEGKSKRSKKRK